MAPHAMGFKSCFIASLFNKNIFQGSNPNEEGANLPTSTRAAQSSSEM